MRQLQFENVYEKKNNNMLCSRNFLFFILYRLLSLFYSGWRGDQIVDIGRVKYMPFTVKVLLRIIIVHVCVVFTTRRKSMAILNTMDYAEVEMKSWDLGRA